MVELVKLGIFVVFGSLLTFHGLFGDGLGGRRRGGGDAAGRPAGRRLRRARRHRYRHRRTRGFMAWFGPKGVATMTFSILVLSEGISRGSEIFNLAALAVFVSIIAHGVTDTPGRSGWPAAPSVARRERRPRRVRRRWLVAVVVARGPVHDPAHQHGQQHEGDEPTDQRPVHTAKHIGAPGGRRQPVASRVQGDLLAGRWERPGDLLAALLAEDEAQLTGRPQPVGVRRAEGPARAPSPATAHSRF